jgi:hypothetical protein
LKQFFCSDNLNNSLARKLAIKPIKMLYYATFFGSPEISPERRSEDSQFNNGAGNATPPFAIGSFFIKVFPIPF